MKHLAILFSVLVFWSCNKDQPVVPDPVVSTSGILEFEFQNAVNGEDIVLNSENYITSLNDTYGVSKFKYFISNIKLRNSSGEWAETDSYHFIDQEDPNSNSFNIPTNAGEFTELEFSIGIDSLHNVSTASEGDIDPGTGMFWGMSSNYRFLSFEGSYNGGNGAIFHVGGNEHYKTTNHDLTLTPVKIEEGKTTRIHIMVNVTSLFDSPNQIDLDSTNNITTPDKAASISENYSSGMFMVHHVENP